MDSTTPLYVDGNGNAVHSAEFEIVLINYRSFFDFGKRALDIDRGLCMLLFYDSDHAILISRCRVRN